jgi:hypothetical protein
VSLDAPHLGNGQTKVLVANPQKDHVTIQTPQPGSQSFSIARTLVRGSQDGVLAPADAQFFKLEGPSSPFVDAVVVDSLGNDVLVYHGIGFDAAGHFLFDPTPRIYPVGQNPVSITIQDINGDGISDLLVADQGSNDVAILYGSLDPKTGAWVGTLGPRVSTQALNQPNAGGSGPMAVAVRDVTGPNGHMDGIPDLVVTNQDGTLTVLPGVGGGFFRDVFGSKSSGLAYLLTIPSPEPLLPPPPVANSPILVPTRNQVFSLTPDGAALTPVFIAPTGASIAAAGMDSSNGDLAVAFEGGTVELLHLNPSTGHYDTPITLNPEDGLPPRPSALTVLDTAFGPEVLVTSAGEDQLFVFGVEPHTVPPILSGGGFGQGVTSIPSIENGQAEPFSETSEVTESEGTSVVSISGVPTLLPTVPSQTTTEQTQTLATLLPQSESALGTVATLLTTSTAVEEDQAALGSSVNFTSLLVAPPRKSTTPGRTRKRLPPPRAMTLPPTGVPRRISSGPTCREPWS